MLFRFILIFALYLLSISARADPLSEPLPVMQMNPAMLRFFDPAPDSAQTETAKQRTIVLNQHYASIFLADTLPAPSRYLADMELYIAELQFNYAISQNLAGRITTPLFYSHKGFLDHTIYQFHKTFGLPDGGRSLRVHNSYGYRFVGATDGWNASQRWELGNINMRLKYRTFHDDTLDLALLAGIKLPTASKSRGWGSNNSDLAVGAVASWKSGIFFSHLTAWWIHPFTRSEFGHPVKDYYRGALVTGWKSERFSSWLGMPAALLIQAQGGTSPYRTDVAQLDRDPWLISFGARFMATKGYAWNLTFTENITQNSTQDFGFSLGVQIPLAVCRTYPTS